MKRRCTFCGSSENCAPFHRGAVCARCRADILRTPLSGLPDASSLFCSEVRSMQSAYTDHQTHDPVTASHNGPSPEA